MRLHAHGPLALLLLLSLAADFRPLVGAQERGTPSSPVAGPEVRIGLTGGVSHLQVGTGVSLGLGGTVSLGRFRAGLTPVDATWVPMDPEPGYRRIDVSTGTILCQELASGEFVDEKHCPGFSHWLGAMADLSFSLTQGPDAVFLGGGYRVGEGRGPYLLVSWGPSPYDPSAVWYLQGRLGPDYVQVALGFSIWLGGSAPAGDTGDAGDNPP